jgi:ankyrin repeat protein
MIMSKSANINAKDYDGNTALIRASEKGYIKVVRELLKKGADVRSKNYHGSSALMRASFNGHIDVVRALLENAFIKEPNRFVQKVEVKDNRGYTALIYASRNGHIKIVKMIVKMIKNIKNYVLLPFMNRRFKSVSKDIIRESEKYIA